MTVKICVTILFLIRQEIGASLYALGLAFVAVGACFILSLTHCSYNMDMQGFCQIFLGRCKFSVIFGVGNRKFRTSVVKEPTGNPDWNEESSV